MARHASTKRNTRQQHENKKDRTKRSERGRSSAQLQATRPMLSGCAETLACRSHSDEQGTRACNRQIRNRLATVTSAGNSERRPCTMGKGGENVGQLRLSDRLANVPRLRFASDGRSHHLRQSRMQRGKQAMKLATIVFLSLTVAAVLCWSALHVAQSIARAETSKITHIEREIDQ